MGQNFSGWVRFKTCAVTGFRHARIAPNPDPALRWAKARYRSASGWYESGWNIDDAGLITLQVVVPFNATASVVLSDVAADQLLLNGVPVEAAVRIDAAAALELNAGRYEIVYTTRSS
ncbi:MAG: hypothetical protein JNL42_18090 [Anaerolineae bacterium]|nr:hypothetical protein [Anaerolineae bacterium]